MKKANVHYLEYESIEFTTAVGRVWRVYGSPVSNLIVVICGKQFDYFSRQHLSMRQGHSSMKEGRKLKVIIRRFFLRNGTLSYSSYLR